MWTPYPCFACSAIDPPARQTKSAEWALTINAVLFLTLFIGLFSRLLYGLTFACNEADEIMRSFCKGMHFIYCGTVITTKT
ncbi:hypothetical protein D3C81_2130180 [compost metagenome]